MKDFAHHTMLAIEEMENTLAFASKEGKKPPKELRGKVEALSNLVQEILTMLGQYTSPGEGYEYPKPKPTKAAEEKGTDDSQQHRYALESLARYMARRGKKDEPAGMGAHYFSKAHSVQERAGLGDQGSGRFFNVKLASEGQKAAEADEYLRQVRQRLGYGNYWKTEGDDE